MLDWMLNTLYELFHLLLMTFLLVRLPPFQMKKTEAWKSSIAIVTWEHIFSDNDIQTIMWGVEGKVWRCPLVPAFVLLTAWPRATEQVSLDALPREVAGLAALIIKIPSKTKILWHLTQ